MRRPRILFVIYAGNYLAGGVRRALDYLPALREAGWETTVVNYWSPRIYELLRAGSSVKRRIVQDVKAKGVRSAWLLGLPLAPLALILGLAAKAVLKLLWSVHTGCVWLRLLASAGSYDVLFFQAVAPPPFLARLLKKRWRKIVFDIDDAVFVLRPAETEALLRSVAVATPGSHYNATYCERHCGKVIFLPTPVPYEAFEGAARRASRSENGTMRIGWVGSSSTAPYLDVLTVPLGRLGEKYPGRFTLCVVGAANRADLIPRPDHVSVEVIDWVPPEKIPDIVAGFDVGVMPLHDTEWEQGKCGLKALEYMASGVPALCSAVGENNYIIRDGVNGMLARGPEEWEEKLEQLLHDPGLRRRLGDAGQDTVRERYSTEKCFRILLDDVLNPLLSRTG